jgi:4'-phosphopantetheinyl transferase
LPINSNCSPQIWLAKVGDEHVSLEHQVLEHLSSCEHKRLNSIKSNHKRREYLLSRALMRHALSEQFRRKPQEWDFVEKTNSPPTIKNLPEGYWLSLSHSNGTICFVLHKNPIGIDIEQRKARTNFSALAKAFMSEDELELLNSNETLISDNFYKVWCAKEAFYKMTSPTEQEGMYLKKIDYFGLAKGKKHHLVHGCIDECHLALVTNVVLENINALQARTFNGSIQIQWA